MPFRSLSYNPPSRRRHIAGRHGGMLILVICLIVALPGCSSQSSSRAPKLSSDTTCAACNNFYEYANRTWLDTASIPPASGSWGVWSANDTRVLTQLHEILQTATAAASQPGQTASQKKLGLLNSSCMDSARAERDGIKPLRPALASISSIANPADIAREIARLHNDGVQAVFRFSSDVDRTGDLHYIATIEQGRQALSTQGYLANDSAANRRRIAYREHVTRTFVLAGESPDSAQLDAGRVLTLETALAKASMTRQQEDNESLTQMFRHFSLADLRKITPGFSWDNYLRDRNAPALSSLVVPQPEFLTAVAQLVSTRPVPEWRAYFRWQVLSDASRFLSSSFAGESFKFSQQSSGATVQEPRWQRCVREVSTDVPELLGRAYIEHTFSPESKARIDTMVKEIRAVLVERIKIVPWLTEPTRLQALQKANAFGVKIAYPDKWHDYTSLQITPGSFITARTQALRFENARMMERIDSLPDPEQWDFHGQYHYIPQSPTAWANWTEIIFPAAYLQSPNYDSTADMAANYGAIGVIIGHEMTHLFTAFGGDIDAKGRIRRWWTDTDSTRFAVLQARLVRQYNGYTVLDSATHVNGAATVSENLADVGGVELAFAALERSLAGKPRAARGDTTPEMRFFLSYARARVSKSRPAYLRTQVVSDGHAPSVARVNGPLSNSPEFARAFGCKPGDAMAPPDSMQTHIW
jgi:putative endopeptidase